MWTSRSSSFCDLMGIEVPIVQAPMAGGPTTPELVAAVAGQGALGTLAAGALSAEQLREAILAIRQLTNIPFSVNLMVPPPMDEPTSPTEDVLRELTAIRSELGLHEDLAEPDPGMPFLEQVDVLLELGVRRVSFTFGPPPLEVTHRLKNEGAILIGTATSVSEARQLEELGMDAVIVQSFEAGGHRGSFSSDGSGVGIGGIALIPQVADAVALPILAAGGIMDGRGIAAALCLGASAVQMGTAFLLCTEARIDPLWKKELLQSHCESTCYTNSFSGRVARGIENDFVRRLKGLEPHVAPYPVQNKLTQEIRWQAAAQGKSQYMSMWAGQGAPLSRNHSVRQLITDLIEETQGVFRSLKVN